MPNVIVFDTETTSIEKPFVYDIGFTIYNTDKKEKLLKASFVVEQVWHNRELFSTAYYAEKRAGYIDRLRKKECVMDKLGYITQKMLRLYKQYEVAAGYAFNSPFDDRVFTFNCEWYKIINPFDTIPIYDIRGYVHKALAFTADYQAFCDKYSLYTESGNYSTTAETVYKYITNNPDFVEAHTALEDALIECDILQYCIDKGLEWNTAYKVYNSIPRNVEKTLEVRDTDGNSNYFPYNKMSVYAEKDGKSKIILKKRLDKAETK